MNEQLRVTTTTGTFRALEVGRGPCVLLLHGFPDSPYGQAPLAEALASRGFRSVMPWLRGYAPSLGGGPFHADQLGADAVALADGVGAELIVGHDWGAVAVHRACAMAPSRFRRAVTLSVPHPSAFLGYLARHPAQWLRSWYMLCFQLPLLPEWLLARSDFALVEQLWQAWSPGFCAPPSVLREAKSCLKASLPGPIDYYRAMLRPVGGAFRRIRNAAQQRLATPTLHLHGADDGCVAPAACVGQERFFSGRFESEVISGAGHFLGLEKPKQVATRIATWLDA